MTRAGRIRGLWIRDRPRIPTRAPLDGDVTLPTGVAEQLGALVADLRMRGWSVGAHDVGPMRRGPVTFRGPQELGTVCDRGESATTWSRAVRPRRAPSAGPPSSPPPERDADGA